MNETTMLGRFGQGDTPMGSLQCTVLAIGAALTLTLGACSGGAVDRPSAAPADSASQPDGAPTGPMTVGELYADLGQRSLAPEDLGAYLLERAEQEGGITLYASSGGNDDILEAWAKGFTAAYPKVGARYVSPSTSDFTQLVLSEHRAGRPQADVVRTSSTLLAELQQEGLLVEHAGLLAGDELAPWAVTATGVIDRINPSTLVWNTETVGPGGPPTTWDDFLLPAHAGCGLIETPTWVVGMIAERGEEGAVAWFEGFLANGGQMVLGGSAQLRRLVSGEIDCLVHASAGSVERLRETGAPIDWVSPEATPATVFQFSVLTTTDRPHAAALFVRWASGPEGAQLAADLGDPATHPAAVLRSPRLAPWQDPSSPEFLRTYVVGIDEAAVLEPIAIRLIDRYHTPNVIQR